MYVPACFRETRAEVIESLIAEYPLATLVTLTDGELAASHLPLLHSRTSDAGVLRGHLARANPQWQRYRPDTEALAIFYGPQHYVSPTWYPSTKEHGRVVPTWNYSVVHVRGKLRFTSDPEWLLKNVSALTDHLEARVQVPWRVPDAPSEFVRAMLDSIIGVELAVNSIQGKWKVSQNRSLADRNGVIEALECLDSTDARQMAELVKSYLPK